MGRFGQSGFVTVIEPNKFSFKGLYRRDEV
jgi:hypothetical protein